MEKHYLISDAAKEVNVESHVLRYWEEELELPIKRNELGHRYYTAEDVELFRQIKELKDRGLQLKAIRAVMRGGKLEAWSRGMAMVRQGETQSGMVMDWQDGTQSGMAMDRQGGTQSGMAMDRQGETQSGMVMDRQGEAQYGTFMERETAWLNRGKETAMEEEIEKHMSGKDNRDEEDEIPRMAITIVESEEDRLLSDKKAQRIQYLLKQIIQETVRESSAEICKEIREGLLKELDYQFRIQEERQEERDQQQQKRSEEYYRRMDELLREKCGREENKRQRLWKAFFWNKHRAQEREISVKKE